MLRSSLQCQERFVQFEVYPGREPYLSRLDSNQKDVVLQGRVDRIDSDGVASLAIGDSMVLFEVENLPQDTSGFVRIRCRNLQLYDARL